MAVQIQVQIAVARKVAIHARKVPVHMLNVVKATLLNVIMTILVNLAELMQIQIQIQILAVTHVLVLMLIVQSVPIHMPVILDPEIAESHHVIQFLADHWNAKIEENQIMMNIGVVLVIVPVNGILIHQKAIATVAENQNVINIKINADAERMIVDDATLANLKKLYSLTTVDILLDIIKYEI
jgi:hypothetical protein